MKTFKVFDVSTAIANKPILTLMVATGEWLKCGFTGGVIYLLGEAALPSNRSGCTDPSTLQGGS